MESFPKLILLAIGLAFLLTASAPADAASKVRKQKRHIAQTTASTKTTHYRGTHLFRAGPLYNGPDYMGDDPDPFIRSQIMRDISGRYGGDGN